MAKKTYRIPVYYQMWGLLDVKANSLEEAIDFAKSKDAPLPTEAEYVEDSFQVDTENELIDVFNRDILSAKDMEYIENFWGVIP